MTLASSRNTPISLQFLYSWDNTRHRNMEYFGSRMYQIYNSYIIHRNMDCWQCIKRWLMQMHLIQNFLLSSICSGTRRWSALEPVAGEPPRDWGSEPWGTDGSPRRPGDQAPVGAAPRRDLLLLLGAVHLLGCTGLDHWTQPLWWDPRGGEEWESSAVQGPYQRHWSLEPSVWPQLLTRRCSGLRGGGSRSLWPWGRGQWPLQCWWASGWWRWRQASCWFLTEQLCCTHR